MQAPRMRVGVYVDTEHHERERLARLPDLMDSAGHYLHWPVEGSLPWEDMDLILLVVRDSSLEEAVDTLEPHVRRGQIVVHTCLAQGVQVLDPLEVKGAVVISAGRLSDDHWAVTTVDEMGFSVAELLFAELGLRTIHVADNDRIKIAAAMTYADAIRSLRHDAVDMVANVVGNEEKAEEIINSEFLFANPPTVMGPGGLYEQWKSISDPGFARIFRDTLRRLGELTQKEDVELWAIGREGLS
ncbi:Rossmann-like domain protein [Corynebacterium atrinae]|uniref:6PGD fold domain-containing protein n=1 Tax=Corynebacterium atrinae TaxID=1336740 RepID=UPI0025B2F244|nr:hypothetical protein [Corynebacterium atrinae]WJY64358.1 Rossmann-like domain protein [Corynebacterium atrinae]